MSKTETNLNDALSKASAKADRLSQALLLSLLDRKMATAGIAASDVFAKHAAGQCRLVERGDGFDVDVVTDQGEVRRLPSGALYPVDRLIADFIADERFAAYFAEHPIQKYAAPATAVAREKQPDPKPRPIAPLTRSAFQALSPSERMAHTKGGGWVIDDPVKPKPATRVPAGAKVLTRSCYDALSLLERSDKMRQGFTLVDD